MAQGALLPTTNNFLILGLPGVFDFCGSTVMFIALGLVPASVYQMMRGFIVVITCLFAKFFLGKKYFRHHWLSVIIITFGIILVGLAAIFYGSGETSKSTGSMIAGVVMLVVSQFFTATQFIMEARLFDRYYIHPLKLVGCEGMMGLSISIVFIIIFAFVPCPGIDFCEAPYNHLTEPIGAMKELVTPVTILVCGLAIVLSIAFFNVAGVSVTKFTSAGHRAVVDLSRTVIIWVFFLALGNEKFVGMQLAGFIILTLGSLIFNEVIRLPFCGLNTFTLAALRAKQKGEKNPDPLNVPPYMSSSPGTYDYSRLRESVKLRAASMA